MYLAFYLVAYSLPGNLKVICDLKIKPEFRCCAKKREIRSAVSAVIERLPFKIAVMRLAGTWRA